MPSHRSDGLVLPWPLAENPDRSSWTCLSVLQPWTDVVLVAAKKPENRDWYTSYRGPLLLHAGRGYDGEPGEFDDGIVGSCATVGSPPIDFARAAERRGAILGIADLVGCVRPDAVPEPQRSAWAFGPWCFLLERPLIFVEPVPYRGERGLFSVPHEAVAGALHAAVSWLDLDELPAAPALKLPPRRRRSAPIPAAVQTSLW